VVTIGEQVITGRGRSTFRELALYSANLLKALMDAAKKEMPTFKK
jgi:hypothetical protein